MRKSKRPYIKRKHPPNDIPLNPMDRKEKPKSERRDRIVPERYYNRLGYMSVDKGSMGGVDDDKKRLYSWNAIMPCTRFCGAVEMCPFIDGKHPMAEESPNNPKQLKCMVMVQYLKAVSGVIMENFGGELTESELLRVGMHLIPLYKNLCRLKIEEMGVGMIVSMETGKMSPIYKEMRATIRDIENLWRNLGLLELEKKLRVKAIIPGVGDIMDERNVTRKGMRASK